MEIGGPSPIFTSKGLLPIYPSVNTLDGCNFSSQTVWEGQLKEGNHFAFEKNKEKGRQFISEGSDLPFLADGFYDFILSCHNLEHFANPLKAIFEWKRIIKNGGHLILVLPDKHKTFDHNRPVTELSHIISDYSNNMPESDTTHFEEILHLHDLEMDPGAGTFDQFKKRLEDNINNRCAHHHVYDTQLVKSMLEHAGFSILAIDNLQINIFAIGRKNN